MKINIISHSVTCSSEESLCWWFSNKVIVKLTYRAGCSIQCSVMPCADEIRNPISGRQIVTVGQAYVDAKDCEKFCYIETFLLRDTHSSGCTYFSAHVNLVFPQFYCWKLFASVVEQHYLQWMNGSPPRIFIFLSEKLSWGSSFQFSHIPHLTFESWQVEWYSSGRSSRLTVTNVSARKRRLFCFEHKALDQFSQQQLARGRISKKKKKNRCTNKNKLFIFH